MQLIFWASLRRFSWLVASMLLWCSASLPVQALTLSAAQGLREAVPLADQLSMQHDPSGTWRIDDVSTGAHRDGFVAPHGRGVTGPAGSNVWIRLSLNRSDDAPARWLLRATPPIIEDLTLYAPDGKGGYVVTKAGISLPFDRREIVDHHIVLPIEVGTVSADYYVHLQSRSGQLVSTFDLWQPKGFWQIRSIDYVLIGALLGAAILSIGLNLIFLLWLKDGIYLHYAFYVAAVCALIVVNHGYALEWFIPAHEAAPARLPLIFFCFFNVVATSFMARLFDFRRHWVWAGRIFNFFVAANALALLIALTDQVPSLARWVAMGSLASTLFGALFVCYLIFVRRQYQYLIQAAAFSTATFLGLYKLGHSWLNHAGMAPNTDHLLLLSTVAHLLVLNVAVANRTRRAEINYRAGKDLVLALTREAERTLDARVQERTAELAQVNQKLQVEFVARNALEKQLRLSLDAERHAMRLQQEFVSMVSHEFRTPLAVIDAAAQSLDLSKPGADPAVRPRTAKIRRSVQRLSMLIDNLLTSDRLQLEERALRLEKFDLHSLVGGVVDSFGHAGNDRVMRSAPGHAVFTRGDTALIEIALQNLVYNALKYSATDKPVRVVVRQVLDKAWIDVTDHGGGVPVHETERIFEKYHRAEAAATVPGSGLGLYLAREIARRHDGNVTLISTGPGGSTFRLCLPLWTADAPSS